MYIIFFLKFLPVVFYSSRLEEKKKGADYGNSPRNV